MPSTIIDRRRSIVVTDVRDITVGEIVTEGGVSRRAIRIYGEPVANNQPVEILEVIVESGDRNDLQVDAPGFEY